MCEGQNVDVRCFVCGALLAKRDADGVCIRRGEMHTRVRGSDVSVQIRCYRCRTEQFVHGGDAQSSPTPQSVPSARAS
jgi:ribosomal protein S27E